MARDRGRGTTASARNAATNANAKEKEEEEDRASESDEEEEELEEKESEEKEEKESEDDDDNNESSSGDEEDDNKKTSSSNQRKVETPEARKRRIKDENMAIARAQLVKEKVRLLTQKANAPAQGEQKRKATHWSYVMAEMKWLARDFAAERDWKLEAARRWR